jgi:antitoxin (DNA-binding transcriptional repressor) of toxin-antitoxin stability system
LPPDLTARTFRTVKTATVEDFTAHVADYLGCVEAGEEVALSREGRVVARVSPAQMPAPTKGPAKKPDIMARLNAQYGERCMSAKGAAEIIDGIRSRE